MLTVLAYYKSNFSDLFSDLILRFNLSCSLLEY